MAAFEQVSDYNLLHQVQYKPKTVRYHFRQYMNGVGYYVTLRNMESGDNFEHLVDEMLKKFGDDIHTLNIKNNNLGDNAAEAIKRLLVGSPNLESINFDNNPLGMDVVKVFKEVFPSFKGKDLCFFVRETHITKSDMDELKTLCWKLGIKICSWQINLV